MELEYIIVEGHTKDFTESINQLSKEGWLFCGSISMWQKGGKFWYAQLMSRTLK